MLSTSFRRNAVKSLIEPSITSTSLASQKRILLNTVVCSSKTFRPTAVSTYSTLSNSAYASTTTSSQLTPVFGFNHRFHVQHLPQLQQPQQPPFALLHRFHSTLPGPKTSVNNEAETTSKRSFSALSPDVADLIRAEFESVDLNNDGKMDSEELKQLLRKHKPAFSEAEILEISELFYVGNAGRAVPFDKLLEAIDTIVASNKDNDDIDDTQTHANTNNTNTKQSRNALGVGSCAAEYYYDVNHHQWKKNELDIELKHVEPKTLSDKLAYNAVKLVRLGFDTATGWNGDITAPKVLQRVIFLETIAAVPGMTAAIIRHFKSLRYMERDGGLINMFLEEATNERMHLLTFVGMRDPGHLFRAAVIGSQFVFGSGFLLAYMVSPKFCHRFVGYIEEEACSTYTKIIDAIEHAPEGSDLAKWRTERAPKIGISYWHLGEEGTVLDLMYAVRADEAEHRDVNHEVVGMKPGEVNPRYDPSLRMDQALKTYVRDMMTKVPKTQ